MTGRWPRVRESLLGGDIGGENPSVGKEKSMLTSRKCGTEHGQPEGQCEA